jgi:DNA-directed RNA polymerase subunit K/omega
MVRPPAGFSVFEFVVLSGLRAVQLSRGCTPRVEGPHKRIVIAQLEVASGAVVRAVAPEDPLANPV